MDLGDINITAHKRGDRCEEAVGLWLSVYLAYN